MRLMMMFMMLLLLLLLLLLLVAVVVVCGDGLGTMLKSGNSGECFNPAKSHEVRFQPVGFDFP